MEQEIDLLALQTTGDLEYTAVLSVDGKRVEVLLTTPEGAYHGAIYGGHADGIGHRPYGVELTLLELVGSGDSGYNRILSMSDDCGEFGMAWQIVDHYDPTRSQYIEPIYLM